MMARLERVAVGTLRNPAACLLVILCLLVPQAVGEAIADPAPLALKGHDPVAYFTMGKPVRGVPEISHVWDEQTFHFATPSHRESFAADPVRYLPQFAHFCTMALTRGRAIVANPEYWVISDGKLYLFSQPTGPELFQKALAENTNKAAEQYGVLTQKR